MSVAAIIWPLLIYWLAFFVACFAIIEIAQDQLYDEVTPWVGLKVAGGSLLLAILQTWRPLAFDTMFTSNFSWIILHGIVWFVVFTLIFQFHPQHAAALGILAMLLIPGAAAIGVESIMKPASKSATAPYQPPAKPVRGSMGSPAAPKAAEAPAKSP